MGVVMRKIVLPDVSFTAANRDGSLRKVCATEQLRILISTPCRVGESFSLDDIRTRLPVAEKLEAHERNGRVDILLEDAEYQVILESLRNSTWTGVSRAALALADAVEGAEAVEVVETDGA